MKRFFIALTFIVAGLLWQNSAQAGIGCTVDSTNCTGGVGALCPDNWATANSGSSYNQQVTFYVPDTASIDIQDFISLLPSFVISVPVISGKITAVDNLPSGLTYSCAAPNCEVFISSGSNYSCFVVYGSPCGQSDTLDIDVELTLTLDLSNVTIPGIPIPPGLIPPTQDVPVPLNAELPLVSTAPALVLTLSPNTQYLCPGNPITLGVPAGFADYSWNTGANGSTLNQLTVVSGPGQAGVYGVTVTDNNGCTFSTTEELFELEAVANGPFTVCADEFVLLVAEGGDNFTWSGPNGLIVNANEAEAAVLDLTTSTTFKVLVSNGTCTDSTNVVVTIDNSTCVRDCADCTPQRSGCTPGSSGKVCPAIVAVTRGSNFNGNFSFAVPNLISAQTVVDALGLGIPIPPGIIPAGLDLEVDSVEIDDVNGLPSGFSWETDQLGSGNMYFPALSSQTGNGCVSFCGTTCDAPGREGASLDFQCYVTLPSGIRNTLQSIVDLAGLGFTIPSVAPVPVSTNFSFDLPGTLLEITPNDSASLVVEAGGSVTLETPGSGFNSYVWSSGETTASIVVTESGTYTVTATDAAGCQQIDEVTVDVLAVGIAGVKELETAVNVYPNPNAGMFEVTFGLTQTQAVKVSVLDVQGREVYTATAQGENGINRHVIDLVNAPTGLYLLHISTNEGVVNRKVTVK